MPNPRDSLFIRLSTFGFFLADSASDGSIGIDANAHPVGNLDGEIHLELAPASNQSYGASLTTEQLFIVVLAILASLAFLTGRIV